MQNSMLTLTTSIPCGGGGNNTPLRSQVLHSKTNSKVNAKTANTITLQSHTKDSTLESKSNVKVYKDNPKALDSNLNTKAMNPNALDSKNHLNSEPLKFNSLDSNPLILNRLISQFLSLIRHRNNKIYSLIRNNNIINICYNLFSSIKVNILNKSNNGFIAQRLIQGE